jgi:hypothetical protein
MDIAFGKGARLLFAVPSIGAVFVSGALLIERLAAARPQLGSGERLTVVFVVLVAALDVAGLVSIVRAESRTWFGTASVVIGLTICVGGAAAISLALVFLAALV